MSKENAKKFVRFMLRECGEFSKEDMEAALKDMKDGAGSELSDEELKAISGGQDGKLFRAPAQDEKYWKSQMPVQKG